MMLARSHVVAIAALLLLAAAGPSFAAKRTSDTKNAVHAVEPHRPVNSSSAIRPDDRDPYAPGVNWPGKW